VLSSESSTRESDLDRACQSDVKLSYLDSQGARIYYDEVEIIGDSSLSYARFYLYHYSENHTIIWLIERLRSHGVKDPLKIINHLLSIGEIELFGPDDFLRPTHRDSPLSYRRFVSASAFSSRPSPQGSERNAHALPARYPDVSPLIFSNGYLRSLIDSALDDYNFERLSRKMVEILSSASSIPPKKESTVWLYPYSESLEIASKSLPFIFDNLGLSQSHLVTLSPTLCNKLGLNHWQILDKELLPYSLPGRGAIGLNCGNYLTFKCNYCGEPFPHSHSCLLRACPNCYEKWAGVEGHTAAWRLWAGKSLINRSLGIRGRLLHIILSFPDTGEFYGSSRTRCYDVMKRHGICGGAVEFHPFRTDDEHQYVADGHIHFHVQGYAVGDILPARQEIGDDLLCHKLGYPFLHSSLSNCLSDTPLYAELVSALCDYILPDMVVTLQASRDYVFKVIPDARYNDFKGFRSPFHLAKVIGYALSHCGIIRNFHALTYFGILSYNCLTNDLLKEDDPEFWALFDKLNGVRCPKCGSFDTEIYVPGPDAVDDFHESVLSEYHAVVPPPVSTAGGPYAL